MNKKGRKIRVYSESREQVHSEIGKGNRKSIVKLVLGGFQISLVLVLFHRRSRYRCALMLLM